MKGWRAPGWRPPPVSSISDHGDIPRQAMTTTESTTTRMANPPAAMAAAPASAKRAVTLSCRNVWKLFGHGGEAFLKAHPDATEEALARADLIRAVRAVSLDVHQGEIFVIMGLSG